ncbi:PP2C family protein-serine/threonine phosphatase [Bacillus taeanensis]|uniref:Serine/threonine protein phosphatase n=1 Tax=Bacillus taeanensis TaxID=273032 RepID=A0A366XTS3_9BACI|nr:protein phosphatase 2C domain-containing protein [Bacillus taeanensis]RBW68948.1 serine/threonine protein phosphatase [Bacillus taeanensis]
MKFKTISLFTVFLYTSSAFSCAASELTPIHLSTLERFQSFIQKTPLSFYVILALAVVLLFSLMRWRRIRTSSSNQHDKKAAAFITPGNAQHIGARTEQQDAFAFSDLTDYETIKKFGVLSIVADGMGGLSGGREASQTAVQTFLYTYLNSTFETIEERLDDALYTANKAVYELSLQKELQGQMGTTLIAAVIKDQYLYWRSAGDSRIYLYRQQNLTQLTKDHIYGTKLDQKAADGEITTEEAANHPERNYLTSFLGLETIPEIDRQHTPLILLPEDRVMLCSDGLYGRLTELEMINHLHFNPQEAADKLLQSVLRKQHPKQDNVTAAILGYQTS